MVESKFLVGAAMNPRAWQESSWVEAAKEKKKHALDSGGSMPRKVLLREKNREWDHEGFELGEVCGEIGVDGVIFRVPGALFFDRYVACSGKLQAEHDSREVLDARY